MIDLTNDQLEALIEFNSDKFSTAAKYDRDASNKVRIYDDNGSLLAIITDIHWKHITDG